MDRIVGITVAVARRCIDDPLVSELLLDCELGVTVPSIRTIAEELE